jgi:hypothetical protein
MSFLSTQALFVALGSSTTKAALASAAFTWVLKDGIGQLGGILFASRYGSNFDEDIKKWRFQSWTIYCASIYIEIMTLKFPQYFLAIASIANICKSLFYDLSLVKNICFILSSASRAQINVRFAKRNNVGDIQGKSVSQFTASTLFGVGLGMVLTKLIDITQLGHLMPIFCAMTTVSMACNYYSMFVIDEENFNN